MNLSKFIAHRGLHDLSLWAPENSLEAVRRAVQKGYAIEIDIRMSKDGCLVVFHDSTLTRMTGVDGEVSEKTFAYLKTLRLQGTSEKIPSLLEILKAVNGKVPLLIEIKTTDKNHYVEKRLVKMMSQYRGFWAIQSFNPLIVRWFYKNAPKVLRGQLVNGKTKENSAFKDLISGHYLWKTFSHPHFISYNLKEITPEEIFKIMEQGYKLLTWTANSEELGKEASKFSDFVIFENFLP